MSGKFVPRPIRPVGVHQVNGWRLKSYEVTMDGTPIEFSIRDAVEATLVDSLPDTGTGEHDIGFLITHPGELAVWVLVGLWTGDIVSQHTFRAPLENPRGFERVPVGGPTACVFELPVHAHEAQALINYVLDPLPGPDVEGFLSDFLDTSA